MTSRVEAAAAAVESGLVVGIPTDTVYGVGADPLNAAAVARLFELKGRPAHKPIGLLVASAQQASVVGLVEGRAAELAVEHWPGAMTLVVRPRVVMADWVGDAQSETVGVRVPDHPAALDLLERTGPLAVTSANKSGGTEAMSDVEARGAFGDEVAVYLEGVCPGGAASTVVDATGPRLSVLRAGPIKI